MGVRNAMSKLLFEKAGEALAIGHVAMYYIHYIVLYYNVKLVQFQQIHNDQQGKEGGTFFLNSHLNASSQRMVAHLHAAIVVSSRYS